MLFHLIVPNSPVRKLRINGFTIRRHNPFSNVTIPCSPTIYVDSQGRDVTTYNSPLHSWMAKTIKTSSTLNKRPREEGLLGILKETQKAASTKGNMWTLWKSWFEQTIYKEAFLQKGKLSINWIWDAIKKLLILLVVGIGRVGGRGKREGIWGYMYMYSWFTLLYSRN